MILLRLRRTSLIIGRLRDEDGLRCENGAICWDLCAADGTSEFYFGPMGDAFFVEEVLLVAGEDDDGFVDCDVLVTDAAGSLHISYVLHSGKFLSHIHLAATASFATAAVHAEEAAEDRHENY